MKKSLISGAILFATCSLTNSAIAYEAGDWLVRAGATNVAPDESSGNVFVGGNDLGIGVNVGSNTQLGLNVAYFIQPNLAIELLAATPFDHDIGLNTVGALGSTKHLPPTLSANYYFADADSKLQPYLGAGLNYTVFFDESFTGSNEAAGFSDLELDDSFGVSVQAGLDFILDSTWSINASVRWIDIDTEATFKLNDAAGKVDVEIDPFVYTLSVGYRF